MADHIARPGEYLNYRCDPLGVLIVRGDDGVLPAFGERLSPPRECPMPRIRFLPT